MVNFIITEYLSCDISAQPSDTRSYKKPNDIDGQ